MSNNSSVAESATMTIPGLVLRLFGMVFGNLALALSAVLIIRHGNGIGSIPDIVYGLTVPLLIVIRFADIRYFNGSTGEGKPATMRDWSRYSIRIAIIAAFVWCLAHGAAMLIAK